LAREALGSDTGLAPTTEEEMLAQPAADTLENLTAVTSSSAGASLPHVSENPVTEDLAENDQLVPNEFAAAPHESAAAFSNEAGEVSLQLGARSTGGPSSSAEPMPNDDEFLHEREVESTAEGMPAGELDDEPPKADAARSAE